jgi:3-oxoadipate enol-lactonase
MMDVVILAHDSAGEGPAVVLLHAGIGDRRLWDYQWSWLTASYRTVRCDLAGFGQTSLPRGHYRHGADVMALLKAVGIDQAVIVGGSLGARVALEVAVACPAMVSALVLVSPSLPGHDWSPEVQAFGDAEDEALGREDLDTAVELNLKMFFDGPRRPSSAVDPARRSSVGRMQRRAFELQRCADERCVEELLVPDLAEHVAEITAPSVVMVGEHDVSDFHAIAARLTTSLVEARHVVVPDTAHVPYYERPDVFDRVLLEVLEDLFPSTLFGRA